MASKVYSVTDFRRDCGWLADFDALDLQKVDSEMKMEASRPLMESGTEAESGSPLGYEERFCHGTEGVTLWSHFFPVEGQTLALAFFASKTARRDVALVNFMARSLAMNALLQSLPMVYSPSGVTVFLRRVHGNPHHDRISTPPGFFAPRIVGLPTAVSRGIGRAVHTWECSLSMPSHDRSVVQITGTICGCLFGSLPEAGRHVDAEEATYLLEAAILGGSRDVVAFYCNIYKDCVMLLDDERANLYSTAILFGAAARTDDLIVLKMIKAGGVPGISEAEVALCDRASNEALAPLHLAFRYRSHIVTQYLLDVVVRADPTFFDSEPAQNCLFCAVVGDNVAGFTHLLQRAPHFVEQGDSQLIVACVVEALNGQKAGTVSDSMLDAMRASFSNIDTFTAALRLRDVELILRLDELFTVDMTATDEYGALLLHHFARFNQRTLCELLLTKFGVSPNARDGSGKTPLHWSAQAGARIPTRVLLDHGADPTVRDSAGKTAKEYLTEPFLECFFPEFYC